MKKTILTGLAALATLAAPISTQAQLLMSIDTAAKTFALSGSDSGTLTPVGPSSYNVAWTQFVPGVDAIETLDIDSSWYSMNPGDIFLDSINFGLSPGRVTITLTATAQAQTISGLGVPLSYAGLSANNQAAFESLIGQTMPLAAGSGFQAVSVVPEPHEYAAMAGLGLLGFAGFRRWRQRA